MKNPLLVTTEGAEPSVLKLPSVPVSRLDEKELNNISFLLVDFTPSWRTGFKIIGEIRRSGWPQVYLKPIVIFNGGESPVQVAQSADEIIADGVPCDEKLFSALSSKLEKINAKIAMLREISPEGDPNLSFKVLRYMFTRGGEFNPEPSIKNRAGFSYPQLQIMFPKDDQTVLETLDYLESENLLVANFFSKSYACTHCSCAFLNFYESCPDCGSSDLITDELLHHFKCAYVGEMSDFRKGQQLICPKCDTILKHIGVDYDKPSIVYHCRSCRNITQEPKVMTVCYGCGRNTEPENQVNRVINTYSITSIGENCARFGMESLLHRILEKKVKVLPYAFFKDFFQIELSRIQRYKKSTSCLAILQIEKIDRIYGILGKRSSEIFDELSELLKSELRTSDIFTIRDETIFLAIYTETIPDNVELAVNRMEKRIVALLETNLKMGFSINKKIIPMTSHFELDASVEKFLQEVDAG